MDIPFIIPVGNMEAVPFFYNHHQHNAITKSTLPPTPTKVLTCSSSPTRYFLSFYKKHYHDKQLVLKIQALTPFQKLTMKPSYSYYLPLLALILTSPVRTQITSVAPSIVPVPPAPPLIVPVPDQVDSCTPVDANTCQLFWNTNSGGIASGILQGSVWALSVRLSFFSATIL